MGLFPEIPFLSDALKFGGQLLGMDVDRKNRIASETQQNKNIGYQKEFAQKGIGWRVEDARAAGINPLAALGANVHSYQPNQLFTPPYKNRVGTALKNMGQDVDRAVHANATKQDRALSTQILIEQLRGSKLANDGQEIKNSQNSIPQGIPKTNDPLVNAMNTQGQGNAGNNTTSGNAAVMVKPDEYTPMKQLGVSGATSPMKKHYVDEHGWVWNILNQDAAESVESDNATQFSMRMHQGHRWVSGADRNVVPKIKIPNGYRLAYYRHLNQWRVIKAGQKKKYYKIRR